MRFSIFFLATCAVTWLSLSIRADDRISILPAGNAVADQRGTIQATIKQVSVTRRGTMKSRSRRSYLRPLTSGAIDEGQQQKQDDEKLVAAERPKHSNLILIIHGWKSNPDVWAGSMAATYKELLLQKGLIDKCEFDLVDWRTDADSSGPTTAAVNAYALGTGRAERIHAGDYHVIHILCHSAGSWYGDAIADKLRKLGDDAFVHITFFDAYVPDEWKNGEHLGDTADFAEHYRDPRWTNFERVINAAGPLHTLGLSGPVLRSAWNVDVSAMDPEQSATNFGFPDLWIVPEIARVHAWPITWYNRHSFKTGYGIDMSPFFGKSEHGLMLRARGDALQFKPRKEK